MAQNKHKIKRSIICILCASVIALYALSIPTYAVISVSRGEGTDYTMSANSSFPMTLGFVYKSSLNSTYNYTLCTDIGGYGQEFPRTDYGEDVVTYQYDELGTSTEVIRHIDYDFSTPFVTPNANFINQLNGNKLGYYQLRIGSYTPDNPDQEVTSIIIKGSDIVYNRAWLDLYEQSGKTLDIAEHAYFGIPTLKLNELLDDNTAQKLAGRVNISYYIQGASTTKERVAFSYEVDTSIVNNNLLLLSIDNLLSYDVSDNPRLLITDYECYIDVDYYEYVEPEPQDELVGTWVFNNVLDTSNIYSIWYFTFSSAGSVYERLSRTVSENGDGLNNMWYYSGSSGSKVYDSSWNSDNYKTITIAPSDDPFLDGDTLLTFLQANATKQDSSATVAEAGTWEKVTSNYPNYIYLTMPTYDTSGAYSSDSAQVIAQNTYYSFPNANSYVNSIDRMNLEDFDLTSWLGTATKGFLDFQLWENFTIGGVLAILVTIPLMIWVLKLFAGG